MTRHKQRDKLKRSHFYTFGFYRGKDRPNSLQGDGYTRIVYCNQPDIHEQQNLSYHKNAISTTKYNVITFFPKALFEQFRRVANLYFLAAACLSLTPISPFGPVSQILPLVFVVGLSMAKEALEDWNRFIQDTQVNSRKVFVHRRNGIFRPREWQKVRVGDAVKVEKDQFFPADLLLLSSSYEDGICYVETMNLDGETNLKVKRSLEVTMPIDNNEAFRDFSGVIKCENPNSSLYTFIGNFEYKDQLYSLDPSQILLRDSKLRNTAYVYGVVIYTGHDSKVMQNSTKAPSKRSTIEKKLDTVMYFLFALLLLVSLLSSIGCFWITVHEEVNWWYNFDDASINNPATAVFLHYITCLILYGYLIPISLYVSIEIVKVLQVTFINQDLQMFDDEKGLPVKARTSNLNEDLGQVHTILSDKTGTLTCNQMDFLKCSIAGVAYGVQASEVELAAEKQMARELEEEEKDNVSKFPWSKNIEAFENINGVTHHETDSEGSNVTGRSDKDKKKTIKGFSFEDERLTSGKWSKETNAEVYWLYFRILAVCHTAIPDIDEETGAIRYEAESPDEGAFLLAAKEFGFKFCKRTQSSVFVLERYSDSGYEPVERQYQILNVLDFTSKRKRMSVIVRDEKGSLFLFCKGADTIIFDRLSKNGGTYVEATTKHLNEYGEGGLRTLVLAYKKLDEKEYSAWSDEFHKAKITVGSERDAVLEKLSEEMENDLILVGATAVEDKLQKGAPRCIDKLAQAGIKIWVLTGDKMETAINIGYACSLLREGMKILTLTALNSDTKFAYGNGEIKEDLSDQITEASKKIKFEDDPHAAFALIVDGKTLTYALEEDMKKKFLDLAIECASVICCRVSPKQKALVTRLVKEGTHKITLAIGDGANDVGMIQEADVGVGISGFEGMQAVMASDFAIAQFRFLERLLLVHGHWCYKRMAKMICYFFYKNITFALTLLYFEAYAGFSGPSVYSGLYMTMFNLLLTSFPVITLGVFEQDVSPEVCLQFPTLYKQGSNNMFFNWHSISGWMMNGIYSSIVIFFLNLKILFDQAIHVEGKTADMSSIGTAIFTSIIWVVNCQIALLINHFIWIQAFFVSGSIAIWYIFLVVDGMLPPELSGDVYEIFNEVLGPAVAFWAATLLVTLTCNLPYLLHISFQRYFNPIDHHIIQEIKFFKKDIHDRHMWTRELSKSTREAKIGFTARVQEKKRQYREKTQKKKSSLGMLQMCTRG